jgi:hypothetical protein
LKLKHNCAGTAPECNTRGEREALATGRGNVGDFEACTTAVDLAMKRGVKTMMVIPGGVAGQTRVAGAIAP